VTWVWTIAYGILTPILLIALIPERKMPGGDPQTGPTPAWLARALLGFGLVFVVAAVVLYAVPATVGKVWPWALTPLTGRILGSWSMGFGLVMAGASRQRDRFAVFPSTVGLATFGILQLVTVVRFGSDVDWGDPGAWPYLAFLVTAVSFGLAGASATRARVSVTAGTPSAPAFTP
jgi:hypothetical protein